ncbi:MAG TPA: hypothetical protein PKL65_01885 [Bacteroidales bacterium]|jgi:hypothetical protein|nr:hypothetical protein [Bacteroidales bacterium]HNR40957.1 hypothetical protein [Bacteroidales bacterium]HPM19024.1 hypothetical protein [Bacteroidales bacterium]
METINRKSSGKAAKGSVVNGSSAGRVPLFRAKYLLTFILPVFLLMCIMPAEASAGTGKGRNSSCHARKVSFAYPVVASKKNNPVINVSKKHSKKSGSRNHSFPI